MRASVRTSLVPFALLTCVGLVGCSGSSKKPKDPHQAQRDAAEARRKELYDAKPVRPYETRERLAYKAADRCGQGPFRIETDALRARYGEQIVVYACGEHEISGNYRLTVARKGQKADSSESAFGFGRDNEACKGDRASVVQVAPGGGAGGSSTKGGGGPARGAGRPAAPPAKLTAASLERVTVVPESCRSRSSILDSTYYGTADWVPLDAHLTLELWSDEPNDLEGLAFVIEKRAVVSDMTPERWQAYLDADRAWYDRYRAYLDGEVASGRTTLLDMKVKTPPPPAPRTEVRPPRPSKNARWIPGYWHYADASFHWIVGLWDVPEEDVAKELTVQAPKPPPAAPPAAERPPEPRPTQAAVWAPGQWQWDGRVYVWVPGAWRIPPSGQHAWRPAGWSIRGRGAIFVPGGWRVRR